MTYRLTVNGVATEVEAPGMRRLLDVLREDLGLTGTKEGCGEGECGACSVLLDGMVVDACLVPLCQASGSAVETVEGLADGGEPDLNVLQAAFLETGGAQCGICTPGMLMAGEAFLASGAEPTEDAVREAIAGNLCRCTGYTKIIDAIVLAAERRRTAADATPDLQPDRCRPSRRSRARPPWPTRIGSWPTAAPPGARWPAEPTCWSRSPASSVRRPSGSSTSGPWTSCAASTWRVTSSSSAH